MSWLRAAVLGASDGIVSTSKLLLGVAAVVSGATSMAAGEYDSTKSQKDSEQVGIERKRVKLSTDENGELNNLEPIYVARRLDHALRDSWLSS